MKPYQTEDFLGLDMANLEVVIQRCSQNCNFIKKETSIQMLSCEFCEFLKNSFFTEQIQATASKPTSRNTCGTEDNCNNINELVEMENCHDRKMFSNNLRTF